MSYVQFVCSLFSIIIIIYFNINMPYSSKFMLACPRGLLFCVISAFF
jgi:hypothetical protein